MLEVLRANFTRCDAGNDLTALLLQAAPRELVWANTHNSRIRDVDYRTGAGQNRLGIMLMRVRTEIANE